MDCCLIILWANKPRRNCLWPWITICQITASIHYHQRYGCYRSSGASYHSHFEQFVLPCLAPLPQIMCLTSLQPHPPYVHIFLSQFPTWKHWWQRNLSIVAIVMLRKNIVCNTVFFEKSLFQMITSILLLTNKLTNIIVVDGGNPYNPPILASTIWTSPYLWLEGILLSISSVKMSYTAAMLHGCISPNNIIVIKMNWCTLQYILILRKIGRCQCHIYA